MRHITHSHTFRDWGAPVGIAWVRLSVTNRRTAKTTPTGMPIANSLSTSRRSTTAVTQAATVTQNKTTGNQPETIETLPAFGRARARATATAATAAAAPAARTQRGGRNPGRRRWPDGPAAFWLVPGWLMSSWFGLSVRMLMADVFLGSASGVDGPTVGQAAAAVPRQTP